MAFTKERRHPRAKVSIPVNWGTAPNCGFEGVIAILSLVGCLIKTRMYAPKGHVVFIRMSLNGEGQAASVLRGHVKYEMEGIGLGVEFEGLTEEEQTTIGDIVDFSTVQRASSN
jgi:hypothetical protein